MHKLTQRSILFGAVAAPFVAHPKAGLAFDHVVPGVGRPTVTRDATVPPFIYVRGWSANYSRYVGRPISVHDD
jgi:hypothetical protein